MLLRPPGDADVAAWEAAGRDREVVLGYGAWVDSGPFPPGEVEEMVASLRHQPWGWMIESDGAPVGHLRLHDVDLDARRARVSLGLFEARLLGRGLGTAALQAACAWAAGEPLGLRTLTLAVAEYNARAIACYRKCGFVEIGREARAFELEGRWVDDLVMQADLTGLETLTDP